MSTTTPTVVVNARVPQRHAEMLRAIADQNASTVSRTVGRIVAERLDTLGDTGGVGLTSERDFMTARRRKFPPPTSRTSEGAHPDNSGSGR